MGEEKAGEGERERMEVRERVEGRERKDELFYREMINILSLKQEVK